MKTDKHESIFRVTIEQRFMAWWEKAGRDATREQKLAAIDAWHAGAYAAVDVLFEQARRFEAIEQARQDTARRT